MGNYFDHARIEKQDAAKGIDFVANGVGSQFARSAVRMPASPTRLEYWATAFVVVDDRHTVLDVLEQAESLRSNLYKMSFYLLGTGSDQFAPDDAY